MTLRLVTKLFGKAAATAIIAWVVTEAWAGARELINAANDIEVFLGTVVIIAIVTFTPYALYLIWRNHESDT